MKILATLSICLFVCHASFGQTTAATTKSSKSSKDVKLSKSVIYGTIKNMRNKPVKGVEAFVYKPDSSIIASGITDSAGRYETNGVPAGPYFVKLVYPSTKSVIVSGITLKTGSAELNLKADAPEADTTYTYDVLMPKPEPKKAGKGKK